MLEQVNFQGTWLPLNSAEDVGENVSYGPDFCHAFHKIEKSKCHTPWMHPVLAPWMHPVNLSKPAGDGEHAARIHGGWFHAARMPAVNGTLSCVSYLETDFPTRWVCVKGAVQKKNMKMQDVTP